MPIYDSGSLNTNAIVVPDAYVGITPPQSLTNGASSSRLGLVGVASWGPVGMPSIVGDVPSGVQALGPITVRKYDLMTALYLAALQGVSDFRVVRVTDGSDTKASVTVPNATLTADQAAFNAVALAVNAGTGVLRNASSLVRFDSVAGVFTALYSGVYGNTVQVATAPGSKAGTLRVVVSSIAAQPEVFDNIAVTGSVPGLASYTLTGGTDGDAGVTATIATGDEGVSSGMYALEGQGCSVILVVDADDGSTWSPMAVFAASEGAVAVVAGPSGDTIAAAIARKAGLGIDSWRLWVLHGDYVWILDQANQVIRLVSPSALAAGLEASLSPEESPLNKAVNGVLGSQRTGLATSGVSGRYTTAELTALFQAGIDVLTNPAPGGAYWTMRAGHNSSSDQTRQGMAYSSMTNFVSKSVLAIAGKYDGMVISATVLLKANAEFNSFFANLQAQGMIGSLDGTQPWKVVCDQSNNPVSSTGLGYLKASIQCKYLGIIEKFLIDLEGGASVTIGA